LLGRGPISLVLYIPFAYAIFLTNRIALEPRRPPRAPEDWFAVV
jgi:hypothetical protein